MTAPDPAAATARHCGDAPYLLNWVCREGAFDAPSMRCGIGARQGRGEWVWPQWMIAKGFPCG